MAKLVSANTARFHFHLSYVPGLVPSTVPTPDLKVTRGRPCIFKDALAYRLVSKPKWIGSWACLLYHSSPISVNNNRLSFAKKLILFV